MAAARLEVAVRLRQEGRGAGDEETHVPRDRTVEGGRVQQAGVEGRHPHHRRRLRHQADHLARVEFRQQDHRAARDQRDVHRDEEAVGVEDREGMQQHVRLGEAPVVRERFGVGQKVALAQHRALGAPRRAGGVEEGGEVVFAAGDGVEIVGAGRGQRGERAPALRRKGQHPGIAPRGLHRGRAGGVDDEDPRAGIADEIFCLGGGVGGVERQDDQAGLRAARHDAKRVGRLVDLQRDPVARLRARAGQGVGVAGGIAGEGGMGHRAGPRNVQERRVAPGIRAEEAVVERVGHGPFLRHGGGGVKRV